MAGGAFALCVVQPEGNAGRGPAGRLVGHLDLLRMGGPGPSRGIVLFLCQEGAEPASTKQWKARRFSHLVRKDQDDSPSSLIRILARALASSWLRGDGCCRLPSAGHGLFLEVVASHTLPGTVAALAKGQGWSESTLRRLHREVGLPCPRDCLRMGAALEVAALGQMGVGSAQRAARLLGFSNSSSLSRHLRVLGGVTAATLLGQGGRDRALSELRWGGPRRSA